VIRIVRNKACIAVCCAIIALAMPARLSADAPQSSAYELPSDQQVIAFLLQSVDWYRHMYAGRQIANDLTDLLFLDDDQPIEAQIVRLSFEFAKADAALAMKATSSRNETARSTQAGGASSDVARFIEMKNRNDQETQKATQDVDSLKRHLAVARGADRRKLQTALDGAQSRLEFLEAGSKTLHDLVEFVQSAGAGQSRHEDLASAIYDLAQTVPEVNSPATPLSKLPMQDAISKEASGAHDSGILGLASELAVLNSKLRIIDEKERFTENLALSTQNLRTPIAASISHVESGAFTTLRTGDLSLLQQQKAQLDALTVELKSLSPAIVALDKQKVLLTVYKSHLADWRRTVAGQNRQAWKRLIVRVIIVLLIIALLASLGEFSRRLTFRHIQDPNRRRLIVILQRLLTLFTVVVVAGFGFASDLSSLATYLGLLTAGMAVALQNVIVASVGYLLLVGKRGIRIGDRVQISGITGEVIDIGLLQFQLREFDQQKQQFTGKVATFSNSFVFLSPANGLLKFNSDYVKALEVNEDRGGSGFNGARAGAGANN